MLPADSRVASDMRTLLFFGEKMSGFYVYINKNYIYKSKIYNINPCFATTAIHVLFFGQQPIKTMVNWWCPKAEELRPSTPPRQPRRFPSDGGSS